MINNWYREILNVLAMSACIVYLIMPIIFITRYMLLKPKDTKLSKNEITKRNIILTLSGLIFAVTLIGLSIGLTNHPKNIMEICIYTLILFTAMFFLIGLIGIIKHLFSINIKRRGYK